MNRDNIAMIVSILACFILFFIMNNLLNLLNILFYIEYDEIKIYRHYDDEEADGAITNIGYYIIFLSVMLSSRIFYWIIFLKDDFYSRTSGFNWKSKLKWRYTVIGVSTYVFIMYAKNYLPNLPYLDYFIFIASTIFIPYIFYIKYNKIKQEESKKSV